ncbi:MAG: ABC transporter ATP-binding protein [Hyphomicrobiaceae bacterium]
MSDTGQGPLLSVEQLTVAADTGFKAVDVISFSMAPGEVLAVVGESGSGKTATGRAIIGLLPPGLQVTSGTIHFEGRDLCRIGAQQLRHLRGPAIGMVFQEPMTSLNPALSIGRQLVEGLELHTKMSRAEIHSACIAMLTRVGIADPDGCLAAYPHEFSGGMRQRIMLASVMLLKPRLLIADEPTTALDTLTQAEVLDLMVELTHENNTAVMLITHNLGLVARYAKRAIVMREGTIVEEGEAQALLAAPKHHYTQALVDALPRRRAARPSAVSGEPLIRVENLAVGFGGRRRLFGRSPAIRAVEGVDLAIRPGEVVALVGGSGSGKTTLGRAMLRLTDTANGRILFRGADVTGMTGAALLPFRLACQIVYQDPYSSLDQRMSVGAIVGEPLRLVPGLDDADKARRVASILNDVGLTGFADRYPHQLSGGQRQRVAIARALIRRPAFVVADEPVSALDMTIQKQILTLLHALQRDYGFACLFVSHDLAAVEEIADRVVVMHKGRIVEHGSRDAVFDHPTHDYTRALLAATPRIGNPTQSGA